MNGWNEKLRQFSIQPTLFSFTNRLITLISFSRFFNAWFRANLAIYSIYPSIYRIEQIVCEHRFNH